MNNIEKRTEIIPEPRIGSGHPKIDPHLPDLNVPKKPQKNNDNSGNKKKQTQKNS